MKRQAFTLVELSIVLVILGILMGGIVKGLSMVENARLKRVQQDIQQIQTAINLYMDKYGVLPGDDPNPKGTALPDCNPGGNGDGELALFVNSGSITADLLEQFCMWQELALEGIISGDTSIRFNNGSTLRQVAKRTPYGGYYMAWTVSTQVSWPSNFGLRSGELVILLYLPSQRAQKLDERFDDGDPGSGIIRAIGITTSYPNSGDIYIIWNF